MDKCRFEVGQMSCTSSFHTSLYEALIIATEMIKDHPAGLAVIDHSARPGSVQVWGIADGKLVAISRKETKDE